MARVQPQGGQRIGLALSGGALKASAHVGILNALHRLGIQPDCIAGTSAGAFVAAAYAHGLREPEFEHMLRSFPGRKLLDYGFPVASSLWSLLSTRWMPHGRHRMPPLASGLLRGRRLRNYVTNVIGRRQVEMPFYVIATDLLTGRPVTFSNDTQAQDAGIAYPIGEIAEAVVASCSLPGVLTPIRRDPWLLADGACRHYVPVRVLREVGCQKIIAVNLYQLDEDWSPQSFVHVMTRSYDILLKDAVENDMSGDDLFVLSPDTGKISWLSFDEVANGVRSGERVVAEQKAQLQAFLNQGDGHTNPSSLPRVRLAADRPPRRG